MPFKLKRSRNVSVNGNVVKAPGTNIREPRGARNSETEVPAQINRNTRQFFWSVTL